MVLSLRYELRVPKEAYNTAVSGDLSTNNSTTLHIGNSSQQYNTI